MPAKDIIAGNGAKVVQHAQDAEHPDEYPEAHTHVALLKTVDRHPRRVRPLGKFGGWHAPPFAGEPKPRAEIRGGALLARIEGLGVLHVSYRGHNYRLCQIYDTQEPQHHRGVSWRDDLTRSDRTDLLRSLAQSYADTFEGFEFRNVYPLRGSRSQTRYLIHLTHAATAADRFKETCDSCYKIGTLLAVMTEDLAAICQAAQAGGYGTFDAKSRTIIWLREREPNPVLFPDLG